MAWRAGERFPPPPSPGPTPPLTSPPPAAGAPGRLRSAILSSSRSSPAPCCHFPYSPGRGRLVSARNLFLNKTKTGSPRRAPGDRLPAPLLARLARGTVLRAVLGGCPSSFPSGAAEPLWCASWAVLWPVRRARRTCARTPRVLQIAPFRLFLVGRCPGLFSSGFAAD